jgi:hypothetical protein
VNAQRIDEIQGVALQEPVREWQARWLGWGKEWVDSIDPLMNGFLSKLKQQFGELEELEAFVAQLNEEKATETA